MPLAIPGRITPPFVYWSDWQNFGYLFEALLKFTWETPCGLLVDGKSDLGRGLACCDASFQGIDYCPENDNPLLRCPHERKDCPHSISGFPVSLSAPATPPANGILSSKAPRRWKQREARDSTGNTWRLPEAPTAPAWLAVMAMMAAVLKSNTMWSSVFAAAARILSVSFASRSGT